MDPREETIIQEKMRRLLQNPPQYAFSGVKRTELISRLYKLDEERKSILDYIPTIRIPALRLAPVYATVAATVLVMFGYMFLFKPVYPVLQEVNGTVKVYRAAKKEWMLVKDPKIRLGKNDIVKTFDDGEIDLLVPNLYHLRVKNDSEIRLAKAYSRALPGNIEYELRKGKVFAYFKKSPRRKRTLEIDTSQATASAIGTDFMVQSTPELYKTWVGVLDGAVEVTGLDIPRLKELGKDSVVVKAGEKTIVRKGRAPTVPTRLVENELLEMEELYRLGAKPQVALLISTGTNRVRELLSVTPLFISSDKPGILPQKVEEIAKIFNQAIKGGAKQKHIDSIRKFEDIVNSHPNPKYDVQFLLFIGAYYEYLDEHEKAIETFQRIIDDYPKSGLVSMAQCVIGIIYEEKLNDPEKAKIAYEKVISRYPKSPEIQEAKEGLARLRK